MRLRCSQCNYVGDRDEFLQPSDITPPYYVECPYCRQTNYDFLIVRLSEAEVDVLYDFIKWLEDHHPDTWLTVKLLRKWMPLYLEDMKG